MGTTTILQNSGGRWHAWADDGHKFNVGGYETETGAREALRREIFRASPLLSGFLATALEDLQNNEREEAFQDEREERDIGTIWNCPDETFNAACDICDAFYNGPASELLGESDCSFEQLGSDLYLEMAGHGVGFMDRDHGGEPEDSRRIGQALSDLAVGRSSLEMYLGDDGLAYLA